MIQVKTPLTWEKPLLITQPAFWDRPGPLKKARKGAIMAKVLFIDDEQWVRDLYTAELEDEGHVVIATGDIEFALDLIDTYRPDLIILDLFLNQARGWDVLPAIREIDPTVSVVVLSSYDSFMGDPRLDSASNYLIKNMTSFDELKKTLKEFFPWRSPLLGPGRWDNGL